MNYSHDVIEKLQSEFPKSTVAFRKTDVTNRSNVESAFNEIHGKYGHIDVLVNSAGIYDEQNFEKTFAINVVCNLFDCLNWEFVLNVWIYLKLGTINCTQVAIDLMSLEKGGKGGIIANVASTVGLDIFFFQPIYNATKHAVIGFTRSLGVSTLRAPDGFSLCGLIFIEILFSCRTNFTMTFMEWNSWSSVPESPFRHSLVVLVISSTVRTLRRLVLKNTT